MNIEQTKTNGSQHRQMALWIGALVVGAVAGLFAPDWFGRLMDFVATVYTRLFRFVAVPTIVLAVITTLASFGRRQETGRIFRRTLVYTLLTTLAAALVGLVLYCVVQPGNLPSELANSGVADIPDTLGEKTYYDHMLSVVPDNVVRPFLEGNVLSLLLIAFAVGLAMVAMPDTAQKQVLVQGLQGLQELLYTLIRGLIRILPIGIVAFAAQLSAQLSAGVVADSLGKYILVIVGGNLIQFFVVLPLFLVVRGLHPLYTLRRMMPAVLMALFTKSSAATLPVTMATAEERLGVNERVSRFVLPICTTVNMNGCAAYVLVTSLFVMQNGGVVLTWPLMLLWVLVSVVSAIGNAGVPMGCYFLTLSLMVGQGMPIGIMGLLLPIYTIIDMVETAENVWSDACVCAMTDQDLKRVEHP